MLGGKLSSMFRSAADRFGSTALGSALSDAKSSVQDKLGDALGGLKNRIQSALSDETGAADGDPDAWNFPRSDSDVPVEAAADEAATNLAGADEELSQAAGWVKPQAGMHDVVIHGSPGPGGGFVRDGASVGADEVAASIRANPNYGGGPVRLISCYAACNGSAQALATELDVEVVAPDWKVYLWPNGDLSVGRGASYAGGAWRSFKPQ